jgi:hypothetical protein
VDLWALEPRGHALAFDFLGSARKFSKSDVGEHFLEHWATLTQLFVELAAPFLERGTKAAELPFRWEPNDTNGLPWQQYDMEAGKMRARRIIPDAVLELPQAKKRFFIECEMGTHSIVATSDEKAGATLAKTERYDEFLASRGSEPSFYRQAFADGWPSEVLYLVRKDSRAHSINRALETWRKGRGTCVRARAVTLPEAVAQLSPMVAAPCAVPLASPPTTSPTELQDADIETLKRFYQESVKRLDEAYRALNAPVSGDFRELAKSTRALLAKLPTPGAGSSP